MPATATLAALALAQLVTHRPPGRSPYSFEAVAECGKDATSAACPLVPVCDNLHAYWCGAPRWSNSRGAWVKVETREAGLRRYAAWSADLAAVARYVTRCVGEDGVAVESCEPAKWWRGTEDLVLVGAVLSIFEPGMAEGPMMGYPPMGLGRDGEQCALGIMPEHAPKYATWLPKEERERLVKASEKERRAWGMRDLQGPSNLRHCIEVSLRQMVANRSRCKSDFGMFSAYASGRCSTSAPTVPLRVALLNKMRMVKPKLPEWAVAELASEEPAVVASTE